MNPPRTSLRPLFIFRVENREFTLYCSATRAAPGARPGTLLNQRPRSSVLHMVVCDGVASADDRGKHEVLFWSAC